MMTYGNVMLYNYSNTNVVTNLGNTFSDPRRNISFQRHVSNDSGNDFASILNLEEEKLRSNSL